MIILHSKNTVRRSSPERVHRMGRNRHDSPELVRIRDIDDILDILSLDEGRSENRRDERDQNGGLEKAGHGVCSLAGTSTRERVARGRGANRNKVPKPGGEGFYAPSPRGGSERIVCFTSNAVLRREILDFRLAGWSSISRGKPRDLPSQLSGSPGASWSSGHLYLGEARKRVDLRVTGCPDHALPTLGANWGVASSRGRQGPRSHHRRASIPCPHHRVCVGYEVYWFHWGHQILGESLVQCLQVVGTATRPTGPSLSNTIYTLVRSTFPLM